MNDSAPNCRELKEALHSAADWLELHKSELIKEHEPAVNAATLTDAVLVDALRVIGYRLARGIPAPQIEMTPTIPGAGESRLLVDARSPREHAHDHIPGAVSAPVVDNGEYEVVGKMHRVDPHAAYVFGVTAALRRMAGSIDEIVSRARDSGCLVYCFRGGKRSRLWCNVLARAGVQVTRLQGGWKAYRKAVLSELESLPGKFNYIILCGATGCGKTRLLQTLAQRGEQVLDLEALALHRGSMIGGIPERPQPSQKAFDSALRTLLHSFNPARLVWVESESKKIGQIQLPPALISAMRVGTTLRVEMAMPHRVALWHQEYPNLAAEPIGMVNTLQSVLPLIGREEYAKWQELAQARDTAPLFEAVMANYYDPLYERSLARNYPSLAAAPVIRISGVDASAFAAATEQALSSIEKAARTRSVLPSITARHSAGTSDTTNITT